MSKSPWKKHKNIEEEIIEILKEMNIATANVIHYELKRNGYDTSYGLVVRRLEFLRSEKKISCFQNSSSNQKIWSLTTFE